MRTLACFLLSLLFTAAWADQRQPHLQLAEIDSLAGVLVYANPDSTLQLAHEGLRLAEQAGDDRMAMRMYTHISNAWQLVGHLDSVDGYNTLLWERARATRDTLMMVTALGKIASHRFLAGNVDSAIHYLQHSIALIPFLEEKYQRGLFFTTHANLGIMYQRKGVLATAHRHFAKALQYAPEGCAPQRVNLLNVQATLYFELKIFDRAEKLLRQALACNEQNPNLDRITVVVLNNLGEIYLDHHRDYRQAISYFNRSIELNGGKFPKSHFFSLAGKADAYLKLNEPDSARILLREAARLIENGVVSPETESFLCLGEASLALSENDLSLAKEKAARAIEIAEAAGYGPILQDAYRIWLSAALKMAGNEPYSAYFERYVTLIDSIDRTRLAQSMALLEAELVNTRTRDSLYQARVEKAYLETLHSAQSAALWMSMLLLLIVSILAWSWFKQWRLAEAQRAALLEKNRHLLEHQQQRKQKTQSVRELVQQARTEKFHPDNGQWSVVLNQITHVSSDGNLITFHLTDGSQRQMWGSLSSLSNILPDFLFVRCYQSFIVNLDEVKEVRANEVILKNEQRLRVGRTYKKNFMEKWQQYIQS